MKRFICIILAVIMIFPASLTAYADLSATATEYTVGESFTVDYKIPNKVSNVGAVSLFINYDPSILHATKISAKNLNSADGKEVSLVYPESNSDGSFGASWVEAYCSVEIPADTSVLQIAFEAIGAGENSQITSELVIKGIADPHDTLSNGTDDLTSLAGVSNAPFVVTIKEKPKVIAIKNEFGEDITNTMQQIELTEINAVQLTAEMLADTATPDVEWSSSNNDIATVNESGLVSFLNSGEVSITATAVEDDKLSERVNFEVFYRGFSASDTFTADIDEKTAVYGQPVIKGLQQGDSVQMKIYAADKTEVLDPSLFKYSSDNENVAVDENGLISAIKSDNRATVTAKLLGDTLNRECSVKINTIPVQTGSVDVKPEKLEASEVAFIDGNGNLCEEAAAVTYALFIDKIPKGETAQTYKILVSSVDSEGVVIPTTKGKYTWASSDSKVASVKEDADGNAIITIKPNVDGACVITATRKDTTKAQGSISVYVRDYAPRLEANKLTLDVQKQNEASLPLVSSYGNNITEVKYIDSLERLSLVYDETNERITFSAPEYLKNQTIKGNLLVITEKGEHTFPLNVTVKNSAPSVTTKQAKKFNLFNLDSSADISVTVKNETVTDVQLVSDDFVGTWNDGVLTVGYKSTTPPAKPNTKATLKLSLEGYAYPFEKAVTIGTENAKPSLALDATSGTVNTEYDVPEIYLGVLDKKAKTELDLSNVTASLRPENAGTVSIENNKLKLSIAEDYAGGKLIISLKDANWISPINLNYTLKVNTTEASLKLKSKTLTVNSLFPSSEAATDLVISHANIDPTEIKGQAVPESPGTDADKISVSIEDGKLVARITDNTVLPGTYKFNFEAEYDGTVFAPQQVGVKVVDTQPKVSLSTTSLTLNATGGVAGRESVSTELICGTEDLEVAGFEIAPAVNGILVSGGESNTATFKIDTNAIPEAGSYKFNVTPIVSNGEDEAKLNAIPLTVKVISNAKYTATVKASGKLDAVQRETSAITYTVTKLANVVGKVSAVNIEGNDAELFTVAMAEPDAKGQATAKLMLDPNADYSTKVSYKIKLRFTLDSGIEVCTNELTVKVANTAIKLKAEPAAQTIFQSQSRYRTVSYKVQLTSPIDADIGEVTVGEVGLLQRPLVNQETNISIGKVSDDGKSFTVTVRIKDTSALVAKKTYTLPLLVKAEGQATNVAATKLNLSLKVLK